MILDRFGAVVFLDKPLLKFERLLETYYGFAPRGLISFATAMPLWIAMQIMKGLGIHVHPVPVKRNFCMAFGQFLTRLIVAMILEDRYEVSQRTFFSGMDIIACQKVVLRAIQVLISKCHLDGFS
jgi:hypothetical protein